MASASGSATAQQRWELENSVKELDSTEMDAIFHYDAQQQVAVQNQKPWTKDPHYFQHVRISALALLKMAMHCRSGGNLEVMGVMQGKIIDNTFVVLDAFALPVEGTETRVSAANEANEYMVDFIGQSKHVGRPENLVGWYHSHPGYGCWMSGIDCSTQDLNQQYQDPFLALVIDPVRTVAAGKVEIGAFRTFPGGYKPPNAPPSDYQTIPLNKIEDFGVHANSYYSLDIQYFKSSLDSTLLNLLWNKYWVNTLSSSPILGNREFLAGAINDLAEKIEQAESQLAHPGRAGGFALPGEGKKKNDSQLTKISHDSNKVTIEQLTGMSGQVIKEMLFNFRPGRCNCGTAKFNAPVPMQE